MIAVSTEDVGELYVLLTLDEGVYQKLMPIVLSDLRIYPHHIPYLGFIYLLYQQFTPQDPEEV